MTAKIINGKELAETHRALMVKDVEECKRLGRAPHLVVVQVGNDPASDIYVRNKKRFCEGLGITVSHIQFASDCTTSEFRNVITSLNFDSNVDGIMVQMPLPSQFDNFDWSDDVIQPCHDVDGQCNEQLGALMWAEPVEGELYACTAHACIKLIHVAHKSIEGMHMVIVGRSTLCGKPLSMLALREDATVTICHTKTKNLKALTKQADILVVATGRAGLITPDYVKEGATVIDVGISRVDGKVVGDVAPEVAEVAGYITPVPGGVGPMTVAMLARNVIKSCLLRLHKLD